MQTVEVLTVSLEIEIPGDTGGQFNLGGSEEIAVGPMISNPGAKGLSLSPSSFSVGMRTGTLSDTLNTTNYKFNARGYGAALQTTNSGVLNGFRLYKGGANSMSMTKSQTIHSWSLRD